MILYGHDTSPYVRRVRVILQELGVPFERDTNNWAAPGIQAVNPMLRVPALRDGDQVLYDSKLIATYLYDRHGGRHGGPTPAPPPGAPPLQGTLFRPEHRYDDENVLLAIDAAADSAINVFLLDRDEVSSPYLQRQRERVGTCLRFVEERYGGRTTLSGDALSFTDLALVCALEWMHFRQRHDITAYPGLCRVVAAHAGRPSLATTHPSLAVTGLPPATTK